MDKSITPCGKEQPAQLRSAAIGQVLWECAAEAAVKTILILLLGSVALGLVGGLWHDMTPSPPAGLKAKVFHATDGLSALTSTFQKHRFLVVLALVFGLTSWARLTNESTTRFRQRFSGEWFGLIVGNAFGAIGFAIAVYWLEQLSIARWIYGWILHALLPSLQNLGNYLLGANQVQTIGDWLNWYGDNQLKFNFWIFYLAAISDDLGLPNLKSLARALVRRVRNKWIGPNASGNALPARGR